VTSPSQSLLNDLSREDLANWFKAKGEGSFRADQIRRWVFVNRAESFDEMHDLPAKVRDELKNSFAFFASRIIQHQIAKDRTEKLLLELADGQVVECVLMRETGRRTVCVSTQVGCAMGCVFCASGLEGLKRNLSTGEILEQVLRIDRLLEPKERITNIVVMGIGEPLANLKNLLPALNALHDPKGMDLGARRITISTVGLPDRIRELASSGTPYNLAVSLHAPNNLLRDRLVPVNKRIGIEAILAAAEDYFEKTGRRVTYEYVLLAETNDGPSHAHQLATLLEGRNAHVNLIPMNPVAELSFHDPALPRTREFVEILESRGIAVTVRKRKGADIDAACGQLRLHHERQAATAS
jgi:23S rRNA (adenine2503-C2)-methyltransferase